MIKWKVGAYLRLSSDDGDKVESNSITNQKEIVSQYISRENDMKITGFYIDDGYTGTDFDRPDFQRMIEDIKNNKINTVIVKDLSRLGRNYIAVGQYIEEIFPNYNVRFIAINDNVDSYKDPNSLNNLIVPFKNLMNDEYARDISNKVKSVLNSKKKNGEFIGIIVPYGYFRDPLDKHKFIVDPIASKVVKKIFKMALDGKSKHQIIDSLNKMGVLAPKAYQEKNEGKCGNISEKTKLWDRYKIDRILKNKSYTGVLIQNKTRRISHKVHKIIRNNEEDWIVVEKHHDTIISESDFNKVQEMLYNGKDIRINKNNEYDCLAGFLKCKECGNSFTKIKGKTKEYYYCNTYKKNRKCSNHSIGIKDLEEVIKKLIQIQIDLIVEIDEELNKIVDDNDLNYDYEILNSRSCEINKLIIKYESLIRELENDIKNGYISNEEYMEYSYSYNNELNGLKIESEKINKEIEKTSKNNSKIKNWIYHYTCNNGFKNLNRKIMNELIDEIVIDEYKNISVKFKYENEYFEAIDFLKGHNCDIMSRQKEVI